MLRLLGCIGVLGLTAATLCPATALQADAAPPLPERKPPASMLATPVPQVWSPEEIAQARAQCAEVLQRIDAEIEPQDPIKEGNCGTPAPVRLLSIGKNPKVTFKPAALTNCGMLEPLHRWITKEMQPLAIRQLGSRIATVEVMSDYSCRRSLGRKGKRLSQHAYVDALDIRGFITAKGQAVHVLDGWGPNRRDIAALVAAARVAEAKDAATVAEAPAATASVAPAGKAARQKQKLGRDAAHLGGPGETPAAKAQPSVVPPPGPAATGAVPAELAPLMARTSVPNARFLRAAHAAACRIFGTTLGPEANEMHRNHFHVDMAVRKIKRICD